MQPKKESGARMVQHVGDTFLICMIAWPAFILYSLQMSCIVTFEKINMDTVAFSAFAETKMNMKNANKTL